jgi:hypothetical protein
LKLGLEKLNIQRSLNQKSKAKSDPKSRVVIQPPSHKLLISGSKQIFAFVQVLKQNGFQGNAFIGHKNRNLAILKHLLEYIDHLTPEEIIGLVHSVGKEDQNDPDVTPTTKNTRLESCHQCNVDELQTWSAPRRLLNKIDFDYRRHKKRISDFIHFCLSFAFAKAFIMAYFW